MTALMPPPLNQKDTQRQQKQRLQDGYTGIIAYKTGLGQLCEDLEC